VDLTLCLSLALLGILAGIYVAACIHDWRITDLTATQYTAMHQMRDKTFSKVMPLLALTTLALVLIGTAIGLPSGAPRVLGTAALLLLVTDIALTLSRQRPLNEQVQSWTETAIPGDWGHVRDRWAFHHHVRTGLVIAAFASLLAAAFLAR
jgi:uncharacterized membrane protein